MRYVIVISPWTLIAVKPDFVKCVISRTRNVVTTTDVQFVLLPADDNLESCGSNSKSPHINVWYDENAFIGQIEELLSQSEPPDFNQSVCDELFRLADTLPYVGCTVEVLLHLVPLDQTTKSYLSLCGALRRLTDWHNAHVTIVKGDNSSDDYVRPLQAFVKASVVQNLEDIVLKEVVWRGKIAVIDKVENKGFIFSGFTLDRYETDDVKAEIGFPEKHFFHHGMVGEPEGAILGRMMEVLDEVLVSSIPSFIFTPSTFRLNLREGYVQGQTLCDHIKDNPESGVLVRIPCYRPTTQIPVCGKKVLTSLAWQESLIMDASFWQEPEEEHLSGYEFLYFLLVANDNSISARLLKSPQQLSGSVFNHLYNQSLLPCQQDGCDDEVRELLSGLPELSEDAMSQMTSDLSRIQSQCLSSIIDEREKQGLSAEMSVTELYAILTHIQKLYMAEVQDVLPRHKIVDAPGVGAIQTHSELDTNPASWPERLQMMLVESQQKSLSRLQSTDSMQLSSPIQPDQASTVVDAQDFLRYFLPDGSAAADSLSPIRRQRNISVSRISQQSEQDLKSITWPNAINIKYHGVHYNKDRKSERHEQHYSKLRDKYVTNETFSWCSKPGFFMPKTIHKHKMAAPLRRSPRKRVTKLLQDDAPNVVSFSKSRASLKSAKLLKCIENKDSGTSAILSRRHSVATIISSPTKQRSGTNETAQIQDKRVKSDTEPIKDTVTNTLDQSDELLQMQTNVVSSDSAQSKKESRSQRHKRRLESIVDDVLKRKGVEKSSNIYAACSSKLFRVTKIFVMDLPTSENLRDEMRKIAESQVEQVIDLEKRRRSSSRQQSNK
ncbi:hypothetical protein ScPMuIL_013153 [Solemya velum]